MVVSRGWRKGAVSSGIRVALGVMRCFGTRTRWWLHNTVSTLNATELHTSTQVVVCDVNFTSIKNKKVARGRWEGRKGLSKFQAVKKILSQ